MRISKGSLLAIVMIALGRISYLALSNEAALNELQKNENVKYF